MNNDIRETELALKFEKYFDAIAQGNSGKATVETLEQDGSIIRYRVQIRHHDIFYGWLTSLTLYDVTTPVQGEFDLRNPTTFVERQVCIDIGWGIGRVCASLNPLVEAILAEELLAA